MEQPPNLFGGSEPQFNDAGVLEGTSASSFMSTVFTWMVAGLAVTAVAAYYAAESQLYLTIMQGMGRWILLLAPFAFLMVMNFGLQRLSVTSLAMIFLAFAGTMGLSLGGIFYM